MNETKLSSYCVRRIIIITTATTIVKLLVSGISLVLLPIRTNIAEHS